MRRIALIMGVLLLISLVVGGCGEWSPGIGSGPAMVDTVRVVDTVFLYQDGGQDMVFALDPTMQPPHQSKKIIWHTQRYRGQIVSQSGVRYTWYTPTPLDSAQWEVEKNRWMGEPPPLTGNWVRRDSYTRKAQDWDSEQSYFRITSEYEVDSSWIDTICYERRDCEVGE